MSTPTRPRMDRIQLRQLRQRLGLSAARLAELLQVRADTYRHWEGGRYPLPYDLPERLILAAREVEMTAREVARYVEEIKDTLGRL